MTGITLTMLLLAASPAVPRNPEEIRFDMGTADSPLAKHFLRVTPDMRYNVDRGYGFTKLPKTAFDEKIDDKSKFCPVPPVEVNPVGIDALRDGVESDGPVTFRVNLQYGLYCVTVTVGRHSQPRHDYAIRIFDRTVASNLDAWGPACGTPGGPSTRTFKTLSQATEGRIIVTIDCAKPKDDRWTEYTDKAPDGGRLDFLGPNRVDVLAITFRPIAKFPIKLKNGA